MSKYTKFQTIEKMLEAIPFPDDAEIYTTLCSYLNNKRQSTIGIYVSKKNKEESESSFGKYLTITCASLDEAIKQIINYTENLTGN